MVDQKRFLLFGSSYNWLATAEEYIEDFDYVGRCIERARELKLPYTLVIDRFDPRIPVYLNPNQDYQPFEIY